MRTFHIGGTASRVSGSRRSKRVTAAVSVSRASVVEAKDGNLVVMNRSGSLVPGRRTRSRALPDRLRRASQGKEGQAVVGRCADRSGSVRSRSSPRIRASPLRTFSKASRCSGRGHRPVAPHHRRFADEKATGDGDQGRRRSAEVQMPSHATLDGAGRRDGVGQRHHYESLGKPRPRTSRAVCRAWWVFRPESARGNGHHEMTASSSTAASSRDSKIIVVPDSLAPSRANTRCLVAFTSACRKASVRAGEPLMDGPSNRTTS